MVEINDEKVQRDMSQDYVEKLSRILDQIDQLKMEVLGNKYLVFTLNERLHQLMIRLSGKATNEEFEKEKDLFSKTNQLPIVTRIGFRGKIRETIDDNVFPKYYFLLEEREIHLYKIMERLGLTNIQKTRRVH